MSRPTDEACDVCIVGAGFAGLAAAKLRRIDGKNRLSRGRIPKLSLFGLLSVGVALKRDRAHSSSEQLHSKR